MPSAWALIENDIRRSLVSRFPYGVYPKAIVTIGNNSIRDKLSEQLLKASCNLPILVHPKAVVSKYAYIGNGSVVFANSVINAFARIGMNCIINTGTVVEHDCIIGDSVHLSPNVALAGGTIVGEFSWIGIGSVTRQLVTIGSDSIVGANSTVTKNIPSGVTVVGSPAVAIKK